MAYHRKVGHHSLAAELRKQMQQLPSRDPHDPDYRRLRYVRYADDFVLGFIGPKVEAQQVKETLETFLRDTLKLELSREKTLITHATSQAARLLGYELVNQQANDQLDPTGRRRVNGRIGLRVPADVIAQHCQAYMRNGKPTHRSFLIHDEDYSIVDRYQSEYRGVVQYYLLAYNAFHLGRLRSVMEMSLARTLAGRPLIAGSVAHDAPGCGQPGQGGWEGPHRRSHGGDRRRQGGRLLRRARRPGRQAGRSR